MNLIYVLLFTSLLFLPNDTSSVNPRLKAWFKGCQDKTGASDKDYELIKKRKIPATNEGVCMVECLFEKLHIIENGKFNKRGFVITFSPVVKADLRKLSKLKEIASICDEEINDADFKGDCNTTRLVLGCFGRNSNKLDLSRKS